MLNKFSICFILFFCLSAASEGVAASLTPEGHFTHAARIAGPTATRPGRRIQQRNDTPGQ